MDVDRRRAGLQRREALAMGALLLVAGAQYAWNVFSIPPLTGYDAPGHAGYIHALMQEGRLPHPFSGWSTFHPPLYYFLASLLWRALAPAGAFWVMAGLRGIGALAGLAAGLAAFHVVRRLGSGTGPALVAAALVLFLPASQMAAVMIGNEAFAAGVASLAILPLLRLQADPGNPRAAALTGLLAGAALVSKFTGIFAATACIVPFLRLRFDRRMGGALALLALTMAAMAAPVYVRNIRLTGSPVPMTRVHEPMRSTEAAFIIRPREASDYLSLDPKCLAWPSIYKPPSELPATSPLNENMTSVWGLAHASLWFDVFGHRVPFRDRAGGARSGAVLTFLGVFPAALMLLGFLAAVIAAVRSRGRSADAPLVVMALTGLGTFVAFTWSAPSMAAVKGSYLLPLAVPAAAFFARGLALAGRRLRGAALAICACAALAAAVAFTNGAIYTCDPMPRDVVTAWVGYAKHLHSQHILDAMAYLLPAKP
ncbi:MAG: hypothetical protein ACE5FC_08185 [Myxococcota bacterium]